MQATFMPKLRRSNSRHVPAGSRADHHHVILNCFCHSRGDSKQGRRGLANERDVPPGFVRLRIESYTMLQNVTLKTRVTCNICQ